MLTARMALQAALRAGKGGDATAFERIEDGARTVSKGDIVRLSLRPVVVGEVLHFSVQQVRCAHVRCSWHNLQPHSSLEAAPIPALRWGGLWVNLQHCCDAFGTVERADCQAYQSCLWLRDA